MCRLCVVFHVLHKLIYEFCIQSVSSVSQIVVFGAIVFILTLGVICLFFHLLLGCDAFAVWRFIQFGVQQFCNFRYKAGVDNVIITRFLLVLFNCVLWCSRISVCQLFVWVCLFYFAARV